MTKYYHGSTNSELKELSTNHSKDGRVYVTDSRLVALTYAVRTFPNLFTTLPSGQEGFLEILPGLFENMTRGKSAYLYEVEQAEYSPVVQNNKCGHGHCYYTNHDVQVIGKEYITDAYVEFLKFLEQGQFVIVKKEDIPSQQLNTIFKLIESYKTKYSIQEIEHNPILSLFFNGKKEKSMKQPQITYLGHSGFSVELDKYYLLFDYIERYEYEEEGDVVEQKTVDFSKIEKPIIMFHSHWHYDHYNKQLHQRLSNNPNITTILGDITSTLPRTYSLKPRQNLKLSDIEVYTAKSTDAGVCYLVKVDGFVIYFAGDHIDWGDDDPNNEYYWKEVEYLNSLTDHVDYAFIPVCTFYGEEKERITNSAIYAIEKMQPKYTYPMHSSTTADPYYAFAKKVRDKGINTKVILPD